MSIKRLYEGFGIGEDSCISGVHPMRESDPPGLYLGRNPESLGKGLYITYWEAEEIATKIGYPLKVVYDQMVSDLDDKDRYIAELEATLQNEIHDLQMKSISKQIKKGTDEILAAHERTLAAVRARLGGADAVAGPDGSAAGAGVGPKVAARGSKSV